MLNVHGIRVFGGTFPAEIWRAFMIDALKGVPPRPFKLPRSELVKVEIDPVTGLLAAPWCPGEMVTMLRQLAPLEYCPAPLVVPPTPQPAPTTTAPEEEQPRPGRKETPRPRPSDDSPRPRPTPTED